MKISIITLGCKVNEYESRVMMADLISNGYFVTDKITDDADLYIVNTCAVTNIAEKKSRQMLTKIRSKNSNAKILICGCASESDEEQFKVKNIQGIIGTAGKEDAVKFVKEFLMSKMELSSDYKNHSNAQNTGVRQYIKVQDGCNNFCSYCIIPYLRGRSRSRSLTDIKNEILSTDAKEIILTGINLSDYKLDNELAFIELIKTVESCKKRYRIGSLEMNIINDELLNILSNSKYFCPNFHLSLQSGDDRTLARMNRKYKVENFFEKVNLIRKYFGSDVSISTDIIAGFKGETDEEFESTYEFVKKCNFSFMHIFPFSIRKGTVASKLTGDIPKDIILTRVKLLEKLNIAQKEKYASITNGKLHNVLIEEESDDFFYGYTENYIYCTINKSKILSQYNTSIKIGDVLSWENFDIKDGQYYI